MKSTLEAKQQSTYIRGLSDCCCHCLIEGARLRVIQADYQRRVAASWKSFSKRFAQPDFEFRLPADKKTHVLHLG